MSLLESSFNYLERSERYEMMSEIFKLLLPFYEKARDFKVSEGSWGVGTTYLHAAVYRMTGVNDVSC